ncbi:MAG: class I SAM-dependent methyltransferase [Pseudomonadota bacterium]|nr:16S rRNA methyltransferase [Gammaproteobacteria bacterium]MBJ55180.1 16S rRNA methyltransferase [Gammaproteobacteria bacterium]MEC8860207.1 class I SAM-dependent methyltransferase [Pseudomonadota bacterium]HBN13541.1 16S rRNA methyltransferase [Pseudohongiella sp.]|tara:strand:+ start:432 stop:1199 length:768 start_codon:yes stop_codon:yes gene_type:complete
MVELARLLPSGLALEQHADGLTLVSTEEPQAGFVRVDFCDPALTFRRRQSLRKEAVVRAAGAVTANHRVQDVSYQTNTPDEAAPVLLDATTGLGVDAFILACAGWTVLMLEQSPIIHALLTDGLKRAHNQALDSGDATLEIILGRMKLQDCQDARDWFTGSGAQQQLDVIYLDPMFPARQKSARVKKNRYLLQALHGPEAQGQGLLSLACPRARKIVVKRPLSAPPLDADDPTVMRPSASISGKHSRFDIYAGKL